MEFIQIVQRPAYAHRPYGVLRSPYNEHPGCSVLCNHPTAPHTHRNLLNLTRASWLQEVRSHMARAGNTPVDDGDPGGNRTPSSMPFTPIGTEGLQVNIPEEFLARFARSDSRPDSPAPTLLVHSSRLAPFRRCVTPDTLEPLRRPRLPILRRATSLQDVTTTRPQHSFASVPAIRGTGKRKQGRFEADFTTKLSKQLDHVAKGQQQKQQQQQQTPRDQSKQQQDKKGPPSRPGKNQLQSQDSEDSGLGGEKKAGKKSKRGGKKKGEEGGLDDPGQTAISTVSDSRAGSSKRSSGSPHSSKPTSARSSKSSSAHRRMHDPLSYDPKQFLGDNNPPEDESELAKLQEALGGGGSNTLTESEVFWFNLPRSPSHRAAIFTLPVQIKRLRGLSTVDYLKKYMRLRTSRRQLYSMVFTRHRDVESIRIERLLVGDFGKALGDALGGNLTENQIEKLTSMVPLPEEALDKDFFILIAAFAERLFCYELLAAEDVEIEPRDLVEQLDFQQLDERLEEVILDPLLHQMLTTIRDLG
ncbi:uncharacterized protein [Palaemon carinicauda]|uniref:uncharacterized protein n=1 Tax=Palaemon carinicauda TaxID=392227 RepID=UPI0035B62D62